MTFSELLPNFFTHKDFLPPADTIPGTLFTPLHIVFAAIFLAVVITMAIVISRKSEKTVRTVMAVLWGTVVVLEVVKILWESFTGRVVDFNWTGNVPLYPCSIFMYAMPFAIWGKGNVRFAACGYVCTLGFLGGAINFVYPVNVLGSYSCLSFAGMHTLLYHSTIVFCALLMLLSRYHAFTGITNWWQPLLPMAPAAIVSLAAHAVNFSPVGSDYMFFRLNSFFLAPLGAALPDWATVIIVYIAYLIIHATPYLPSYIANRKKAD